jgi:hypothetical protein
MRKLFTFFPLPVVLLNFWWTAGLLQVPTCRPTRRSRLSWWVHAKQIYFDDICSVIHDQLSCFLLMSVVP